MDAAFMANELGFQWAKSVGRVAIKHLMGDNHRDIRPEFVQSLAFSIASDGWMPSSHLLVVEGPVKQNEQFYMVFDGGHRLMAMRKLVKENKITWDFQLPVKIYRGDIPKSISLMMAGLENHEGHRNTTVESFVDRLCWIVKIQKLIDPNKTRKLTVDHIITQLLEKCNCVPQGYAKSNLTKYVTVYNVITQVPRVFNKMRAINTMTGPDKQDQRDMYMQALPPELKKDRSHTYGNDDKIKSSLKSKDVFKLANMYPGVWTKALSTWGPWEDLFMCLTAHYFATMLTTGKSLDNKGAKDLIAKVLKSIICACIQILT